MQVSPSVTCREFVDKSTDFLEGALPAELATTLGQHMEVCTDCRRYMTQVEAVIGLAGGCVDLERAGEERSKACSQAIRGNPSLGSSSAFPACTPGRVEAVSCEATKPLLARRFLSDSLEDHEQIALMRHLMEGCGPCAGVIQATAFPELSKLSAVRRDLRAPETSPGESESFEEALERIIDSEAWVPPARLRSEEFVLWLIRRGRSRLLSEPSTCLRIAEVAFSISRELPRWCRARVAMFQGHVARRTHVDFVQADRFFDEAEVLLEGSHEQVLILAKVHRMRALARFCQSRHSEALQLLDQAEEIYRAEAELARIGETALERAAVELEVLGPRASVETLLGAIALIDWPDSPTYLLATSQNLTIYYAESGSINRATLALQVCREQLSLLDAGLVEQLGVDWAEGKVRNAAGDYEGACRLLRATRREFIQLGLPSQAAFVSLDLAVSLHCCRRYKELAPVAEAMLGYFFSRGITGEALASLKLFHEAVLVRSLTTIQIHCLGRLLARQPDL